VGTIEGLKITSLAGKTVSLISANSEFIGGGSGRSRCGGRGILSFPLSCPCESSRGEEYRCEECILHGDLLIKRGEVGVG
jgi:hypothetical protein